jgi:hypothetical protein
MWIYQLSESRWQQSRESILKDRYGELALSNRTVGDERRPREPPPIIVQKLGLKGVRFHSSITSNLNPSLAAAQIVTG